MERELELVEESHDLLDMKEDIESLDVLIEDELLQGFEDPSEDDFC